MRTNAIVVSLLLACLGGIGSPLRAAEMHTYTVAALAGVGGFFDADPDGGFGNGAILASFTLVTEPGTLLGLRIGRLDQDPEGAFAPLGGATLDWVNVAGEYRMDRPLYSSGIYVGLGGYRLEGEAPGSADETALGAVFGLTGQFDLTDRWALLVDLSAHYADFDDVQTFGVATAGFAFSF